MTFFTVKELLDKCETGDKPCCCIYCTLAKEMKHRAETERKTYERQKQWEQYAEFHSE